VSIIVVFGSFNTISYASSAKNPSSSKIPLEVSGNKHPHQDCWITAEKNGCGQGESNLRHFSPYYWATISFAKYGYLSSSFFVLSDAASCASPYFRNLFLYIRVINAP